MSDTRVLLIGGAPGTGKTTLAQAVSKTLGWRWIPGDALATAMRGVTTKESHPALHVAAGGRHVEYFTEGPPEKLVQDARELQETAWPGFRHVIRFHAKYGPASVIDSWTFAPQNVASLGLDTVAAVWLVIDPDVLEEREKPPPDYVETSTDPARRRANFFHRSTWTNSYVEAEAARLGFPILRQDGSQSVGDHVAQITALLT